MATTAAQASATPSFFLDKKATLPLNWQVVNAIRAQPEWLVKHHLDSFNHFVTHTIPNYLNQNEMVVDGTGNDMGVWVVKFTKPYFVKPYTIDESTPLYPTEACNRGLNYSAQLFCDVITSYQSKRGGEPEITTVEKHYMGDIPVVVGSTLCNTVDESDRYKIGEDMLIRGGYFIINGKEKIIIGQEKLAPNRVYIFNTGTYLTADVRSVPFNSFKSQSMVSVVYKSGLFYFKMGMFTCDIPVFLMLRALGLSDAESCSSIVGIDYEDNEEELDGKSSELVRLIENIILPSVEDVQEVKDRLGATQYIISKIRVDTEKKSVNKMNQLRYIFNEMILPHVGMDPANMTEKAHYICLMIRRLCLVALNLREKDDRDSFANKRAEITGSLLFGRVKLAFTTIQNKIRKVLLTAIKEKDKKKIEVIHHFTHKEFSKKIQVGFDTGNWSDKGESYSNVCQQMSRLSYIAAISDLRQLHVPTSGDGRLVAQRTLHPTQWRLMCPAETPEGKQAGLHKKMALSCHFTLGNDPNLTIETIQSLPDFKPLSECYKDETEQQVCRPLYGLYLDHRYFVKVFVNYRLIGFVARVTEVNQVVQPTAVEFVKELRSCKSDGRLPFDASVFYNYHDCEIHVLVDFGRIVSPVFVVKDNKLVLTEELMRDIVSKYPAHEVLHQLVRHGCIEYVDKNEEEYMLVAESVEELKNPKVVETSLGSGTIKLAKHYTHCEIHPALIFGAAASTVAFADHDQAPRITYQSSMGKQAMGVPMTNFLQRVCDNLLNVMCYPQKPLVQSRMLRMVKTRVNDIEHDDGEEIDGAGQAAIVAFVCKEAYNKEDACILNRGALDRGFANSLNYKTHRVECRKTSGESFGKETVKVDYIDEGGLPRLGKHLTDNDVMVGRYRTVQKDSKASTAKAASQARGPQKEEVEKVDCSERLKTKETVVVSATHKVDGKHEGLAVRTHTVRYPRIGDKFAAAHAQKGVCGMIFNPEDMPFTPSGITPDILMNPHAFPSRMTFGHVLEMLLGKACAITGKYGNATPFEAVSIEDIGAVLKEHGYQKHGEERLIDGQTGEMMKATIFMGICNYQRLKHMVVDKFHSRSDGNIEILTHQPTEGRSRGGGLRTGEMERDCNIVHGMSAFLQERLCKLSDASPVKICPNCKVPFTNKKIDTLDRASVYAAEEEARAKGVAADYSNIKMRVYEVCKSCGSGVETVTMPFAFKLVTQEVMSMGISMMFDTKSIAPSM
jgi:DNA-directed RNA polymerase II subunit RPB2